MSNFRIAVKMIWEIIWHIFLFAGGIILVAGLVLPMIDGRVADATLFGVLFLILRGASESRNK